MRLFAAALAFGTLCVGVVLAIASGPTSSVLDQPRTAVVIEQPQGDPPPALAYARQRPVEPIEEAPSLNLATIRIATPQERPSCGGAPTGVEGHTRAFEDRGPKWAAGDLMERYPLPDGRVLWVFGDTWSGEVSADNKLAETFQFVHSSLLVERGGCFERVQGFDDGSWIPSVEADVMLWPQEVLLQGDELYVFAIKVVVDNSKPVGLNFRQVGGVIAVYDLDELSVPRTMIFDVPDVRGNPFGWGPVLWGGDLYLYAHEEPTGTFVARLNPDDLGDPTAWEFWTGQGWDSDVASASSVAPFRLRVYQPEGSGPDGSVPLRAATVPYLDERLYVFEAPTPVGPWEVVEYVSLDGIRPGEPAWAYEPLAVEQVGSTTVFAVNFLPKDTLRTLEDVTLYGPRFLLAGG